MQSESMQKHISRIAHADRYNSSSEFLEFLYGDLGTDEEEMKELGIDLSDIL